MQLVQGHDQRRLEHGHRTIPVSGCRATHECTTAPHPLVTLLDR